MGVALLVALFAAMIVAGTDAIFRALYIADQAPLPLAFLVLVLGQALVGVGIWQLLAVLGLF
jgi:hypothetical protein